MFKATTGRRRTITGASAILLLVALLTGAPAVASAAKPTSGKAKRPAKPRIALSAQPAQLELHPCLWTTLEVGMTNEGDEPVYATVTITPEGPLELSRQVISSYLPAGYTYVAGVRVSVPADAADGSYEVLIETGDGGKGTRERLSVPVGVVGPACLPRERMRATASSYESSAGTVPENAIDGDMSTLWHSQYRPQRLPLPQSITLDLGGTYDVSRLAYQPRTDGNLNGTITAYNVYASSDGQQFARVGSGTWADDGTLKLAGFDAPAARFIRLEATESHAGRDLASAAEIILFGVAAGA